MIKNLLHISLITYVVKRYKTVIVSTAALFLYIWLVGRIHQDFISFSHLSEDNQYLGLSFVAKWLAFLLGFVLYFFYNALSMSAKNRGPGKEVQGNDQLMSMLKTNVPARQDNSLSATADPFDEIRKKQKLRSKADFVIEKTKKPQGKTL